MGYTHYWNHTKFMPEEWAKLVDATKKVFAYANDRGIALAGGMGDGLPEANDDLIWFNGKGDYSHETFLLEPKGTSFAFCKTAEKPYDAVVTAILILACHFHDGFEASSDGDASDWQKGYELASQATGINSLKIPEGV